MAGERFTFIKELLPNIEERFILRQAKRIIPQYFKDHPYSYDVFDNNDSRLANIKPGHVFDRNRMDITLLTPDNATLTYNNGMRDFNQVITVKPTDKITLARGILPVFSDIEQKEYWLQAGDASIAFTTRNKRLPLEQKGLRVFQGRVNELYDTYNEKRISWSRLTPEQRQNIRQALDTLEQGLKPQRRPVMSPGRVK